MAKDRRPRFLSLHWKGLLVLSLLLVGLSTTFAMLNYLHLKNQFRNQQARTFQTLQAQFGQSIERAADRLQHLGLVLASLTDLERFLTARDKAEFADKEERRYASIRYELDVERVEYFTLEGKSIWEWTPATFHPLPEEMQQAALGKVREKEQPVSVLVCQPTCGLHVFVPILRNGRNLAIVELGQRIADLIIGFHGFTNADVAILVPVAPEERTHSSSEWSRIAALSSAHKLTPFLKALSERYPRWHGITKYDWVPWQGKNYSLSVTRLGDLVEGAKGTVVFIVDVSHTAAELQRGIREGFIVTGSVLVVAELALLLLVRTPLRHLQRLAETLPLLAHGRYREARQRLANNHSHTNSRDEIRILEETSIRLSYQLEETHRTLIADRDFIQGLFDTAQLIILTQNSEGKIHKANQFIVQLTGLDEDELAGRLFTDLVEDSDRKDQIANQLETLFDEFEHRLEHEATLVCQDGSKRHIVWVHTRLRQAHADDVAVLSVGLDVTDRIEAESKMRWLANHDPLTGLVNRARFHEELQRSFAEAERSSASAALLLLDLDHFKDINDSSGHAAGDALLILLANELRERARRSDVLARLGGDEFAVLMPGADRRGAETFAQDLIERLGGRMFQFNARSYRISTSIGIALIPDHGSAVEEVMANADIAMYQAKKAGRGRWHFFSDCDGGRAGAGQRVYWRGVVLRSLEKEGGALLHFQPIVNATTGELVYHEALMRLQLDDGRLAFPADFLEAATRSQLMYAIDAFVAKRALRILTQDKTVRLSINLSNAALDDPRWAEPLKEAVQRGALDPDRLLFEITETAAIADIDAARRTMHDLIALGFVFALDDFGAGFASFYYLKQLPIKYVKIDRSFITKLATEKGDKAFVMALTTLAHGYGQKVIAEGVEDAITLSALRTLGVDFVQGFFVGRPRPELASRPALIEGDDSWPYRLRLEAGRSART
jgi:diguanylate cyclase (GGDEF)-like protein/PAS domain S-box-containing protein